MTRPQLILIPLTLATACFGRPLDDPPAGTGSTSADDVESTSFPSTTPPLTTTDPSTADPDTSTTSTQTTGDTTDTDGPFLEEGESCSLESFNPIPCGPGLKCSPFTVDGTSMYQGAACVPIHPDPVDLYEPCMWLGGAWSGHDNCGDHAFCEDWDGDGQGVCKGTCIFSAGGSPQCDDPMATPGWSCGRCFCSCQVSCDPLAPEECGEGNTCIDLSHPAFLCAPDVSGDMGAYGDECPFVDACDPGLFCASSQLVAACADLEVLGCCTPFCDLTQPNTCPGAAMGEECQPWFPNADLPVGFDHLGYCGIR